MSQPQDLQSRQENNDDEIDLLGLIRSVCATWKVWLIAVIVVTCLYAGFHAAKIALLSNEVTYAKPIRLTFPGAHTLKFPSGAPFSYGDIIAPAVAQIVHERNGLDEYGVSVFDLQSSLSSEPYAPTYPIIVKQYNKMLAARDLTFEQANELRQRMQAELDQASSGAALISMRLNKSQLPETVANKVLSDIPAIWAERTIRDKGVLNLDIKLVSSRSVNQELINSVEYIITGDLLDEKLELLRQNIEILSAFEGSSTIADPETGMHLVDLENSSRDLSRYVINALMSPIRFLGISRDPNLSLYYYEDRLKKLNLELELLTKQAGLARQAYDAYLRAERGGVINSGGEAAPSVAFAQMDSGTLDKLMQMSGEVQREVYKQELNQLWLKYNLDAAEVSNEIKLIDQTIAALRVTAKDSENGQSEKAAAEQVYLDRINETLPDILNKIDGYFDVTQRIYDQLGVESVGTRDRLYTPMTNRVLTQKDSLNPKSIILVWLALMVLTTIIVIPVTMIRRALKDRQQV